MAILKVDWIRVPIRKPFGRDSDLVRSDSGLELRVFMFELPGNPVLANDLKEEHYRRGKILKVIPAVSGPP